MSAIHQKHFRETHPDYVKRQRKLQAARVTAALRLAKEHPAEFSKLYDRVKKERGIK